MKTTLLRNLIYVGALFGVGACSPVLQALTCPSAVSISADNLITMKEFGAIPNQGNALDIAPIFNCALGFAKSHSLRAIYFDEGTYSFYTRPNPIDFPITVVGNGKGRTVLSRDYNGSGPGDGLLTFIAGANGSSVKDLSVVAGVATSHGSAISLIASSSAPAGVLPSPDYSLFSDLYLSAVPGGNWDDTVFVDGRARNTSPMGVRDLDFQNCSVFGAAEGAMRLEGVVGFNFVGGGVFQAGGVSGTSGKILISPSYEGGASEFTSYYVNINTTFVDGILMQASQHGHFSAYFSSPITTSSYSVDNIVIGHVVGGVQLYWQQSKYIDPEN
jgi:hypothetical protein